MGDLWGVEGTTDGQSSNARVVKFIVRRNLMGVRAQRGLNRVVETRENIGRESGFTGPLYPGRKA